MHLRSVVVVEDAELDGGRSGEVAVTLGVGEGQEVHQFLVGLEDVSIERLDRADVLGRE